MGSFLAQIKEVWGRLKLFQRITIIGAAVATLALIGVLVYYGSQPEYGVLFSDLKAADAQSIVEKLKAANVPYQLSGGGTAIAVPIERVTELRLQMAASGVLSGGHVGFDLFDQNNFGATDFTQRINYQRALEGELSRTLEGMDEVESARVHITPTRESVFTEKAQPAKASVVVRVRQNHELSRERTEAMVNLIASSVEGLDPGDVSILDTRGRVLSAPTRDGAGGLGAVAFNSHFKARQQLESDTSARIVSLLEPITGPGHVRADVAADLDFSQVEQTEEKYDPKSSVIRSQQSSQDVRTGPSNNGGVVGARANDPALRPTPTPAPGTAPGAVPAATPPAATNAPTDQRTASTTNFEIDKLVRRTVSGGGRLQRLSVSVVVDHQLQNGNSASRSPEELKKMQDLVAAAVGLNPTRGDQIVVQSMPFSQPGEGQALTIMERYRDLVRTGIKYGALIIAAVLLLIFVIRPAKRALRAASEAAPLLLPAMAGGAPTLEPGHVAPAAGEPGALPAAGIEFTGQALPEGENAAGGRTVAELEAEIIREMESPVPEVKRARAIKNQLIEQGAREPELIAMTIRGWLQEGRK
ncbi:MAG TPA: flagellar basal-body MS-ring/collar protein FliF [Blastocatellia bacterium]|nr:flagellar basal-body MS-ring/collar protein FliF [Blastocatellia bacterium]